MTRILTQDGAAIGSSKRPGQKTSASSKCSFVFEGFLLGPSLLTEPLQNDKVRIDSVNVVSEDLQDLEDLAVCRRCTYKGLPFPP